MWKLILTVIALGFTIGPAPAQNQIEKIAALNMLSGEYLECTAYFSAAAYCMNRLPRSLSAENSARLSAGGEGSPQSRHLHWSCSTRDQLIGRRAIKTGRRCSEAIDQKQLLEYLRPL